MRPRERECYEYMRLGLSTAEIAVVMNITKAGAKVHRKRVNRHLTLMQRQQVDRSRNAR